MPNSPTYRDVCKKCKAYCCSIIRPPITLKEKQDIINSGFEDHFIKVANDIFEIKSKNNNKCPYLTKDLTCKIHKVKPQLCKVWPIVPRQDKIKKTFIVIKCPLYQYLSEKELEQAKKEANLISPQIIQHLWKLLPELKNKFKIFDYQEI